MPKAAISREKIKKVVSLRKSGLSVKQIAEKLSIGISTSSKYCRDVQVSKEGFKKLENRRFPSKLRSQEQKVEASGIVKKLMSKKLSSRELILISSALYWGEGTKRELNLINSDPKLIRSFLVGLNELGVSTSSVKVNIRYYSNQDKADLTKFWLKYLGLQESNLVGYEKVNSSFENKLEYGMCRIRVTKSSLFHKILLNIIDEITSGSSIG
jgi:predicted transcriptional regulator